MESIFDNLPRVDFSSFLTAFDPCHLTKENLKLIEEYRTPNRSYITSSARSVSAEEVGFETLQYIITNCFKCKTEEKFRAIIVLLWKVYSSTKDLNQIKKAKKELVQYLENEPVQKVVSLDYLDDKTKDYENNFFYLIKITIGRNTILKFGITNQQPRLRFTQIKSDIKANYNNQNVSIEPILIVHCGDNIEFEVEVKMQVSEANIDSTNYKFKGSSETLPLRYELTMVQEVVEPLMKKVRANYLYTSFSSSYYEL